MADRQTLLDKEFSRLLATFPNTVLYSKPGSYGYLSVFSSQHEGPQINPSSDDHEVPNTGVVREMIRSAFSELEAYYWTGLLQFWAAVKTGGKQLLTVSDQPYAVRRPFGIDVTEYRLCSLKYQYNIDVNNLEEEPRTPAASAFLNQIPEFLLDLTVYRMNPFVSSALECGLKASFVLPVFYPSQSCCVGVVECSVTDSSVLRRIMGPLKSALEKEGLKMFDVLEHRPFKTVCGIEHAKDEINEALKIIYAAHVVDFAQVWIPYEDENNVVFSSSFEDTKTKRMLGFKLSGHLVYPYDHVYPYDDDDICLFYTYYKDASDMFTLEMGEMPVGKTLQTYKPHFIRNIYLELVNNAMGDVLEDFCFKCSCFVISLRNIQTGDLDYAFEFLWHQSRNNVIFLESLLLTLKRCLPSFKHTYGAEFGDELCIVDAENSTGGEIGSFKIFQGSNLIPVSKELQKKSPLVEEHLARPKAKHKTTPIPLPRQDIEAQFGKTMKEAAKSVGVSVSTLKRKSKVLGISEWHGKDYLKRKVNKLFNNQSDTSEDEAIQDNIGETYLGENTLTIKAEYEGDMIKFHLPMSSATLVAIEKEIYKGFKLNPGDYKLKYLDEEGDWILITSDTNIRGCIKNRRNSTSTAIRMLLLPRKISNPSLESNP